MKTLKETILESSRDILDRAVDFTAALQIEIDENTEGEKLKACNKLMDALQNFLAVYEY